MSCRHLALGTLVLATAASCGLTRGRRATEESTTAEPQVVIARVDPPSSNPPERDDPGAPMVRVEVRGSQASPVPVPYLYGYPLYAEGPALQGVQLLRHDNWTGYTKETLPQPDGVVKVVETFPALGCVFEGVQEDEARYVPLTLSCALPGPKERGHKRAVVGAVEPSAKVDAVIEEPSLRKAFYGEWHAQGQGFDAGEGPGYFDTPGGLLGFAFRKGKLDGVSFVFDPAEKRWRKPELWQEPSLYVVGQ